MEEKEKQFRFCGMPLRFLRILNGYTATQLASKLNCTTALISIIEAGKHEMSIRDTRKMLELFGVTVEQAKSFTNTIEDVKGGFSHGDK